MKSWRRKLILGAVAGAFTGLVLGGLDLATAAARGGVASAEPASVLGVLGLLAGATTVLGALVGLLPTRLRGAIFVVAAWFIGARVAAGPRARVMWMAAYWHVAGALVAALFVALWTRRRRAAGGRTLLAVCGVALHGLAASVYRGLYVEVRAWVVVLAGGLVYAVVHPVASRMRGRVLGAALMLGLSGFVWGVYALRSQEAADWADRTATAGAPAARLVHRWLSSGDAEPGALELQSSPFFGTDLAKLTRERLTRTGPLRGCLLVIIDALRSDLVGTTRDGMRVTPFLDELARGGAAFDRAYAPSAASHMSLFAALSGLWPSRIIATPTGQDSVPLISERLAGAGVETRAAFPRVLHNMRSAEFSRFELGFAHVQQHGEIDPPLARLLDAVRPTGGGRWFSYIHLIGPHAPYDGAAPRFRSGGGAFDLYVAEVRQADDLVGRLFAALRAEGLLEQAVTIVTADHGEEFLEHGGTRHARALFEESIHVPLIVNGPGIEARRIETPVTLVDLAPTLDHLFDLPDADRPSYATRSWTPLLAGVEDPGREQHVLSEIPPFGSEFLTVLSALIGPRWKFIVDERERRTYLYDLERDPGEKRNLASTRPEITRLEWARLKALRSRGTGEAVPRYSELDPTLKYAELSEWPEGARMIFQDIPNHATVLPTWMLARTLIGLAVEGDVATARYLGGLYRSHADADVRACCAALRFAAGLAEAGDREEVLALFERSEDPLVVASVYGTLRRLDDPGVVDRAPRSFPRHQLVYDMARASYLLACGREVDASDLVDRGLAEENVWVRRHAVNLLEYVVRPRDWERLLELYTDDASPRLRAAVLDAAARIDAPPVSQLLEQGALQPSAFEAARALRSIARHGRGGDRSWCALFREGESLPGALGFGGTGSERVVDGATASLPLRTWETGTLGGILIRCAPDSDPPPRVRLTAGTWSLGGVAVPPGLAVLPVLFVLPPDVAADELVLTVEGEGATVLVSGVVTTRSGP